MQEVEKITVVHRIDHDEIYLQFRGCLSPLFPFQEQLVAFFKSSPDITENYLDAKWPGVPVRFIGAENNNAPVRDSSSETAAAEDVVPFNDYDNLVRT